MTDEMELPRQPQAVTLTLRGDLIDVEHYARLIKRAVEVNHDQVTRHHTGPDLALTLIIHPGAVNH